MIRNMRVIDGGAGKPDPAASGLSAGAQAWLLRHLQVRVTAELENPASPDLAPGGVDYQLEFFLSWIPEGRDAEFPALKAALSAAVADQGETVHSADGDLLILDVVLGVADLVIVTVPTPDLILALEVRSATLAQMYPVLFDNGDVADELLDTLVAVDATYAILVDEVTVEPPWAGTDIASLGLGLGLAELARGCLFAAIDTTAGDLERRAATTLGFHPFQQGIGILDLGTTALGERIAMLQTTATTSAG